MCFIIECSVGSYGYSCNQSCDGCISDSCLPAHGYCLDQSGCKPGWQYAKCSMEKCDIGMLKKCSITHMKGKKNASNAGI
jgi:hypothetical protein